MNSSDFVNISGIQRPQYSLGYLSNGLSSYEEFFSHQQDNPPTYDSADNVITPEKEKHPRVDDGGPINGGSPRRLDNIDIKPELEKAGNKEDPSNLQFGPNLAHMIKKTIINSVAQLEISSDVRNSENNSGNQFFASKYKLDK